MSYPPKPKTKPKKTDPQVAMAIFMGGLDNLTDAGIKYGVCIVETNEGARVPAVIFNGGSVHLCMECGSFSAGSKCGYSQCRASTWKVN